MDNRTEDEKARGIVPARIAGSTRSMPTLKAKAARPWKLLVVQTISNVAKDADVRGQGGADTIADVLNLGVLAGDKVLDLLLEYDVTAALGGREYLEENADDSQLYAVLRAVADVHFPFVADVMTATGTLSRLLEASPRSEAAESADQSDPESSASGSSPTGD